MQSLAKAKYLVAQHMAVLSKDTVLFETTGQTAGADRSSDSVNSYISVQEGVFNKNKTYADKYKQFIVDYAQEWYKAVTDRVGTDLKKAEKIRVELDHYQSKVESLRQSANATMAKGKQVDAKAAEKLTRNEQKLVKTKESSSKFVNDLCLLMEEITERSWRDLHPLLIKCSQFETQVTGDESSAMAALNQVVTALKKVASDNGIKPQARLKDLASLDPHALSTRSKDDVRNTQLALENGFAGMGLGSGGSVSGSVHGSAHDRSIYSTTSGVGATTMDNNTMHFPPGSTGAQGMGGFPVRVQSGDMSNGDDLGQTTTSSTNGAPSTMSMMNINAAPAPTMDTMAQAFGGQSMGGGPNSGGSLHSRTGAPAPPPSAAPPPPPPPMGDYSHYGGGTPAPPPVHSPSPYAAPAPSPYGVPSPGPYGAPPPATSPAPPHMMGGYGGSSSNNYRQQSPMGGGFSSQQSPMGGGNFQQSPMGGGNFAQQPSMYGSPAPHQHTSQQPRSAPPSYGSNMANTNPFG